MTNNVGRHSNRFPVTDESRRFYNIFCALGHGKWKCHVAVQFHKTSVGFDSLGQSIEPHGHCDQFFVAGYCRKFFEDCHPRISKKHYFYPKVGNSLLSYNSQVDVGNVRFSFLGANSALQLHLAEKLFFPVWCSSHWFVFAVDLKNKLFVFMDSIFSESSLYQKKVRDRLVCDHSVIYLITVTDMSDHIFVFISLFLISFT